MISVRDIGTLRQPLRVAIVGSGPSGLYAAGHLLNHKSYGNLNVQVDVYERLTTPWGLVRGGVAPDHPNIKAVSRIYERTAAHPEFRFFGNVDYGVDIMHRDLHGRYHAVIFAVGAQADRRMGIRGEDLRGSWAATEFVAWYNGHPGHRDLEIDLSCERVIIVGNGNVAADLARMLALTREELARTDVANHALEILAESQVREIVVLGRRGPAQAAFTNPELLELGEMTEAEVVVDPRDAEVDGASRAWLESDKGNLTARKNVEILRTYAGRGLRGKRRRIVLRFLATPLELLGEHRVEGIRICRNELRDDGRGLYAFPTDATEELACGLVLRSIGYRGTPLEGLPFDEARGTVPHEAGRVLDSDRTPLRGDYVVGWIKRGPTGVIGTNKRDAHETVDELLKDMEAGHLNSPAYPGRDAVEALLAERAPHHITYAGWELIDRAEKAAGEPHGRPRIKLTKTEELLDVASVRTRSASMSTLAGAPAPDV